MGLSRLIALQPQVVAKPAFDHNDVVYYHADEYLPPLDTRSARESELSKADPELSRQVIISVPAEADNRSQDRESRQCLRTGAHVCSWVNPGKPILPPARRGLGCESGNGGQAWCWERTPA